MDLNQHFRFSGLPNNCTLEMCETDKIRSEEDVMICLQLEDGTRLNGNFKPSKNLRDIINEMCPGKSQDNPVVIYMRSEIFGNELEKTSLKSLGVSGGRALLRLINSDPESLKVQANVSAPLPQKPRVEEEEDKKNSKFAAPGPSGAFQFKTVDQLKEKEFAVEAEKMEMEEEISQKPVTPPPTATTVTKIIEEVQKEPEIPPVVNILDDRGTIIFSLDSIKTQSMDLDDSFFELTESDVRLLYKELRQQVDSNENAPLMTRELRKLEENKKILNQLATYKSCAIRIQFPNRYVIQTKFSIVDTVAALKEFVKKFLVNPEMNFYFFVTPPKQILDDKLTMVEAQCVPSALLHFGSDEKFGDLLKPELYEKLSTGSASQVLLNKSTDVGGRSDQPSTSTASKSTLNFMESKSSSKPSGSIPKWFKTTK